MTGIINVNKPSGWTSQDIVSKLRGILREKRIGHGGTLDPMAVGVLPVFVGRATGAVQFFEGADKEYTAGIRFGITTDTQDTTGKIISELPVNFTLAQLEAALHSFTGELLQIPPMYSAVKVNGVPLYKIARRGGETPRQPRTVAVYSAKITGGGAAEYTVHFHVSKGTYIRTLCHDLGRSLGCGACMSGLVRTRAGMFTLEASHTLPEIEAAKQSGDFDELLLPADVLWRDLPRFTASAGQERALKLGQAFRVDMPDGKLLVYGESGEFLSLSRTIGGACTLIRGFFETGGAGK
ncbi:MAG: tRNA pseudouridine(55) synthase TruB [Oscillospiraceae bacterium]|jgi:tRNA pseudouridine55 synthase|nr:tRNA pseudouridine(55) synthase TruB [Oscillospiraceae bacterium]